MHVAWEDWTNYDGAGMDQDIFYKARNATTGTWGTTQVISTGSTDFSYNPSLAVDGAGNVHVAWKDETADYGGSGTDWDIFYKSWVVLMLLFLTTSEGEKARKKRMPGFLFVRRHEKKRMPGFRQSTTRTHW